MPVSLASVRQTHPLIGEYRSIRALSMRLTDTLSAEDQMLQSMPEASPAKWHLAHTTWFFETFVLAPHEAAYRPFDPAFSALFNSYYQALGTPFFRHRRGLLSRPGVEEVQAWRAHVDEAMEDLLAEGCASKMESLILLGLHHEQQHQELLLTDIKHAFFQNPLLPAYRQSRAPEGQAAPLRWVEY
ncbi:MAG: DinB family protein, partial [Alphaproteobacteria bacterium]|nr:DinB family protein [Alphaproteobacteria bacterium]